MDKAIPIQAMDGQFGRMRNPSEKMVKDRMGKCGIRPIRNISYDIVARHLAVIIVRCGQHFFWRADPNNTR
jgi:hypothetical protein